MKSEELGHHHFVISNELMDLVNWGLFSYSLKLRNDFYIF